MCCHRWLVGAYGRLFHSGPQSRTTRMRARKGNDSQLSGTRARGFNDKEYCHSAKVVRRTRGSIRNGYFRRAEASTEKRQEACSYFCSARTLHAAQSCKITSCRTDCLAANPFAGCLVSFASTSCRLICRPHGTDCNPLRCTRVAVKSHSTID